MFYKHLNRTIVLWLCRSTGWERDYIHELFPIPHFLHLSYQELTLLQNNPNTTISIFGNIRLNIKPRVVIYNIENSGSNGKYSAVYNALNYSDVVILVHTADGR